jgi:tetratricopeptide (TPR) repeat protein
VVTVNAINAAQRMTEGVAVIDRARPRTLLEKIIRESEYTIEEWRGRFDDMANDMTENATLSVRQLQRWMAGEVDDARPSSRRVAAQLWGCPFATLLAPPGVVALPVPPVSGGNTVSRAADVAEFNMLEEVTIMAAHESSRHAAESDGSVSPAVIEQVQAEVWRLARNYADMPPLRLLAESRQARNLAYMALDRTKRPTQTKDLYLAAGQLCGLMAVASFDLAVWQAAAEQARAAHVYAELVDHPGLRAWARGTQALIAYWTGRPRQAVVLVEAGLDRAPTGAAEARLRCIEARAWSHIGGDPHRTTDALRAADDAHAGRGGDDLHDEIGGEFGWGPSRHAACAGTALLAIGNAAGAVERARRALQLLPDDPLGGLLTERAHIDLAAAELALGHLDATEEALARVWLVPAPQRRHSLTDRLAHIARVLGSKRWHDDHQASELRDHIEVFNTEAEARALPSA